MGQVVYKSRVISWFIGCWIVILLRSLPFFRKRLGIFQCNLCGYRDVRGGYISITSDPLSEILRAQCQWARYRKSDFPIMILIADKIILINYYILTCVIELFQR